jgi:hypothetical protein
MTCLCDPCPSRLLDVRGDRRDGDLVAEGWVLSPPG